VAGGFGWDCDCVVFGGSKVEEVVGCLLDEFMAVFAEWADKIMDLDTVSYRP
jgi:hypothetical protein